MGNLPARSAAYHRIWRRVQPSVTDASGRGVLPERAQTTGFAKQRVGPRHIHRRDLTAHGRGIRLALAAHVGSGTRRIGRDNRQCRVVVQAAVPDPCRDQHGIPGADLEDGAARPAELDARGAGPSPTTSWLRAW